MNTEPTVEVIRDIAKRMRDYADEVDRCATKLDERKDFAYAAEATNTVMNMLMNIRLDLLVTRPVRELERKLHDARSVE